MRRLLAILPLCLSVFVGGAWGATYKFTDPSAALTAIPTMTASDTMLLGCTLPGPVTFTAGTYDAIPGYSWGVSSNSSDINTGSLMASGGVTFSGGYYLNTSTGRAIYVYGTDGPGEAVFKNCRSLTNATTSANYVTGRIATFDRCSASSPSATSGGLINSNRKLTVTGCVLGPTGNTAIVGSHERIVTNNTFSGCSVGVSITTGTYANNLFHNVTSPVTGASATFMTNSAWDGDVSTWGAGCVSFSGSPFYGTPSADNPWTWRTGPWFPGNFAGVPLPTVPEVATAWYDASAGGETAPMTQGVADGVTYIYTVQNGAGAKSFPVTITETGIYKLSASVSAPDTSQNKWSFRFMGIVDINNALEWDSFAIKSTGIGFHEEDVNTRAGTTGTRYWYLSAGTKSAVFAGYTTNTALASFRLVKVGNPDILGRDRRVPASTIGAVEYYPRPVPDDPFRWDE